MSKTAREVIAEYNFERDVGDHNLEFSLWDEDADAIMLIRLTPKDTNTPYI